MNTLSFLYFRQNSLFLHETWPKRVLLTLPASSRSADVPNEQDKTTLNCFNRLRCGILIGVVFDLGFISEINMQKYLQQKCKS